MKRLILKVSVRFIHLRNRNSWNCISHSRNMLLRYIRIWLEPISEGMLRRVWKTINKTWSIDQEVIRIRTKNYKKYIRSRPNWKYQRNMKMWNQRFNLSIWIIKRVNMINKRIMMRIIMRRIIRNSWIRYKEKTSRLMKWLMVRLWMMWILRMIWTHWMILMKVFIEVIYQVVERISSE